MKNRSLVFEKGVSEFWTGKKSGKNTVIRQKKCRVIR